MSFDEFLATYDIADFAWEIFKGISPTIIALVTIWINTAISKKKAKKDELSNQIQELQLMVSNLSPHIMETGEYLLEAIQNSDKKQKSDEMFDKFYESNSKMLKEARKYLAYANIRAEVLKIKNMDFTNECKSISDYSCELMDILKWYNSKAVMTPMEYFDDLCDEVQKKMIDATTRIEGILFDYCIRLRG